MQASDTNFLLKKMHISAYFQNIIYQMGQIPKKPITEWMTAHKDTEPLIGVQQKAEIIDFIEPDTAYAVVLQAVNQDGPGPYSEQHTIRTMSRGLIYHSHTYKKMGKEIWQMKHNIYHFLLNTEHLLQN